MRWLRHTLKMCVRIKRARRTLPNQASRRVRCEPAAQFPTAELTATCEADRYLARFGPTHLGRCDRSRLVPRDDITADERGAMVATGSVRDRHWSRARIRILGEAEIRPDRTITAVGRDVAGS